jgi:hypothetical protein
MLWYSPIAAYFLRWRVQMTSPSTVFYRCRCSELSRNNLVNGKFTANGNTTGSQGLFAKLQESDGCTVTVPFDYDNVLPVLLQTKSVTYSGSSGSCAAACTTGVPTWYNSASVRCPRNWKQL